MRRYGGASVAVALILSLFAAKAFAGSDNADRQVVRAFSRAIAKVVADAGPAVVSVYTTKTVRMMGPSDSPGFPFPFGSPFDDLFGDQARPRGQQPKERKFRQTGLGSGFIIDAEKGYIVTNNHVIDKAEDIKVRLSDKREFEAKLVGTDPKTDVAVVQIKADHLKAVKLGDSDKLEVGEFVVAIGSPFGLRESVTAGIVSAKGRTNLAIEDYEDFIQTDAAINMGNSGGPLVNVDSEVVGVNTAILSRTGGSMGVGFAIPINMAKSIIDQLLKTGKVVRGWLGVQIQDVTPDMAEKFGLKEPEGALVSQVLDGTPAADAGVKAGDVIVEYGGRKVTNVTKLRSDVAATVPDAKVKLVVLRDGKRTEVTVKIGRLTEAAVAAATGGGGSAESLGLSVQNLTPDLAQSLGLKNVKSGVIVTAVDDTGSAADSGIKQGDVITEVEHRKVKDAAEFEAALKKADLKKGVLLLVVSADGSRFVVLKAEAKKD